ncbi:MAG: R2-like ligand-binding oxidase [Mycobacteriaceae bacterium]|nr:R2-like ligand-binding oxidase [Mycobacteriaceae bacterium]
MTRTIQHGNRNGYASLGAGGLSPESFLMRLFAKGNARQWNPAEIDFAQDAKDFAAMTDDERWMTTSLAAQFLAGEESVTQDLQPFIAAMAAEGRFADEMYLTQFVYEEAKHTLAFRLWFDAVGLTEDLHEYIEFNDPYMQMFTRELPASLYALEQDSSPRNQIRASVTYNHVIEGTLALTGYYAWQKVCTSRGILPGMRRVIKHIGDDERRHMAWGTFTCRRHVAANDDLWQVVQDRMAELMGLATETVAETFRKFDNRPPFGLDPQEMTAYALDKLSRRLGAIESARGGDLLTIDRDASPEALEEKFHAEDRLELTG